jgi:type I restriction enzyme R subunit
VDAGFWVGRRDKLTRAQRWEQLEEDLPYDPNQLDQQIVALDQIRTIIRTYRDRLFSEIFPGRTDVPKTLIFAKDDSHAEDIVHIVRQEFGKGDEFCQKITYRTTGTPPETLIANFRNSYHPRIAVTVDMIATGTDIKPLEALLFMRAVKSRVLFEQMLGRGTRIISPTDLQSVTPDAAYKNRFVIIDTVGIVEQEKVDTQSLERKRSMTFKQVLDAVAVGAIDEDILSSLAARLGRLDKSLDTIDRAQVMELSGGTTLADIANDILDALDPDIAGAIPVKEVIAQAVHPLSSNPDLRNALIAIHAKNEQTIDETSEDRVIEAGFSPIDTEKARALVTSFQQFIYEHKDEITALQIIYNIPRRGDSRIASVGHLTFNELRELAKALHQPPHSWTTEILWRAYAQLEKDRVRGVNTRRVLADLVSLVRHAVQLDDELEPYPDRVAARYRDWLAAQEANGRTFTPDQRWWLDKIAEHIGVNLTVNAEDFNVGEFFNRGGQVSAMRLFGPKLCTLLEELNTSLGELAGEV